MRGQAPRRDIGCFQRYNVRDGFDLNKMDRGRAQEPQSFRTRLSAGRRNKPDTVVVGGSDHGKSTRPIDNQDKILMSKYGAATSADSGRISTYGRSNQREQQWSIGRFKVITMGKLVYENLKNLVSRAIRMSK
jgi:hypothetical protein